MKKDQFGPWLRANIGKLGEGENRGHRVPNPTIALESEAVLGNKGEAGRQPQIIQDQDDLVTQRTPLVLGPGEQIERQRVTKATCVITDPAISTGEGEVKCVALQHFRKVLQGQDTMLFDRSEQQDQLVIGKPNSCVGQDPKEKSGKLREPLQDMTNIIQEGAGELQGVTPVNTKGQWKRKARLKGREGNDMVMTCQDQLHEPGKKRERLEVDPSEEILVDRAVGKKGRMEMHTAVQQHSEVGDTSRNWSQAIR